MNDQIEDIWKEYNERLQMFIRSRVSDRFAQDDILQDVFLKVNANLFSLKSREKVKSWLFQIAHNTIIDFYRSKKQHDHALPDEPFLPDEDSEKRREEIDGCLIPFVNRLPEPYREAVLLSEIEELSQKEIAKRVGISYSGVKSRVQRGRALIKDMLQECCDFEFDQRGSIIDYEKKGDQCKDC